MWQRFTERTRRIILLAQEEASKGNASYVGSEHLLLGVLLEHESMASLLLRDTGITLDLVRPLVQIPATHLNPPAQPAPPPRKKWFGSPPEEHAPQLTNVAKRILELAAEESRAMKLNHIATEHLLLALLREPDTSAAHILRLLGFQADVLHARFLAYVSPEEGASGSPAPKVAPPQEPEPVIESKTKWLLDILEQKHEQEGQSALQVLAESGLDVEAARQKLRERLENEHAEE